VGTTLPPSPGYFCIVFLVIFLDFLSLIFASFTILKQMRKKKEKKWDSKAGKVTLGKVVAYSLTAK